MSTHDTGDFDTVTPDDEEVFASLHRTVAGATLTTSAADVVALGRRTRTRHRVVAAGIGTSAAAIVAAIGVLAPSAGTGAGAGSVPNAAGLAQGAVTTPTTTGGQVLSIQETGFSLEEQADGTVIMNVGNAFDPNKLQAAMDQAGIPAAIVVQQVPDGWDMLRGIQCKPDPGVHPVGHTATEFLNVVFGHSEAEVEIFKSKIPAGVYITLMHYEQHGRNMGGAFGANVGKQTDCVLEHVAGGVPSFW